MILFTSEAQLLLSGGPLRELLPRQRGSVRASCTCPPVSGGVTALLP